MRLSIYYLVGIAFLCQNFANAADTLSIQKCLEKSMISAQVKSTGGHMGECVELSIKNKSNKHVVVYLEAGRSLISNNVEEQDLVLGREEFIALYPQQKRIFSLMSFCNQAENRSPAVESGFTFGEMENDNMVGLCEMFATRRLSNSQMQRAVWVLGSEDPISTMPNSGDTSYMSVLRYVSQRSGQEPTWYTVDYNIRGNHIFRNRPLKVQGVYEYNVCDKALVTVIIYNRYGHAIKSLLINKSLAAGDYQKELDWDVSTTPKDTYFLKRYENGALKDNQEIRL